MKDQARTGTVRVLVSGGGTGGHIFPAIAIANELKRRMPYSEFLFVGAEGRMEMLKVPRSGYPIEGLPIAGIQRRKWWKNVSLPLKLWRSLRRAQQIVTDFGPDLAIGTGGYASGPVLYAAAGRGIPSLVLEPNAYAGLTNKWLAKRVDRICVAFDDMDRFFPAGKLVLTGNPVREQMLESARSHGRLPEKAHVLLIGGSQGARTLNQAMAAATEMIAARPDVSWTWQCGAGYEDDYRNSDTARLSNVQLTAFIDHMDEAYQRASLVIGRAGAMTIAELCYLGKANVLVPSPNVAEDHQTKNAEALAAKGGSLIVTDDQAVEQLVPTVLDLIDQPQHLLKIALAAAAQAQAGAVGRIADVAMQIASLPKTTEA